MFTTHPQQAFWLIAGSKQENVREYAGGKRPFNAGRKDIMLVRDRESCMSLSPCFSGGQPTHHEWGRHTWGECLSMLFKAKHDV